MADEEDGRAISINKPLVLPLSPEALQQVRNPAANFSYEEEFYIFFDALAAMTAEFRKAQMLIPMANAGLMDPQALQDMKENGIRAAKTIAWLAHKAQIPAATAGNLRHEESELDAKRLAWGRKFREALADNPVLTQIWSLRLDQVQNQGLADDPGFVARSEMRIFNSPESHFESHMDKALVEAEEAGHRLDMIRVIIKKARKKWDDGETLSNKEIQAIETAYIEENKDQLQFLLKRKTAMFERIKKRFEEDPNYKKTQEAAEKSNGGVGEMIAALFGSGPEDCGNPECPVHGTAAKAAQQQPADAANTIERHLKSVDAPKNNQKPNLQQIPASSNKEEKDNKTMTTTMTKPNTTGKGKDEDEIKFQNVSVQFVTDPKSKAIQLPDGMTLKEGRYWLQKIEEEETRTFNFEYKFTGWAPLDAMWATYKALVQLHGFVHVGDFQSWFGPVPPSMITIEVDYNKTEQMPWGPIEVNKFSAPLTPSIQLVEGHPTLQFNAKIRNNERFEADRLMKAAHEMLKKESIYRGKAIDVDFEVVNPMNFRFDPTKAPKFWDTSGTKVEELILPKTVEQLVKTNIWTPIRKTQYARQHKIPLRRAILLAGKYGVGKTLGARVTAKIAKENGWTFLYLRKLEQLKEALYFARNYQPCVVFAEDINRITSGKRDEEMDELFNTIDGVDRKNDEVMLVFTTNNIEQIHPGMIRPGRIDTVIEVTPPDAQATERLIRQYGVGLVEEGAVLTNVAKKLEGNIPAIIREAVERSKLAAIADHDGEGDLVVKAEHLETAADQMLVHAEFLKEKPEPKPDLQILGEAMANTIAQGFKARHDNWDATDRQATEHGVKSMLDDAGRPNGKHTQA